MRFEILPVDEIPEPIQFIDLTDDLPDSVTARTLPPGTGNYYQLRHHLLALLRECERRAEAGLDQRERVMLMEEFGIEDSDLKSETRISTIRLLSQWITFGHNGGSAEQVLYDHELPAPLYSWLEEFVFASWDVYRAVEKEPGGWWIQRLRDGEMLLIHDFLDLESLNPDTYLATRVAGVGDLRLATATLGLREESALSIASAINCEISAGLALRDLLHGPIGRRILASAIDESLKGGRFEPGQMSVSRNTAACFKDLEDWSRDEELIASGSMIGGQLWQLEGRGLMLQFIIFKNVNAMVAWRDFHEGDTQRAAEIDCVVLRRMPACWMEGDASSRPPEMFTPAGKGVLLPTRHGAWYQRMDLTSECMQELELGLAWARNFILEVRRNKAA